MTPLVPYNQAPEESLKRMALFVGKAKYAAYFISLVGLALWASRFPSSDAWLTIGLLTLSFLFLLQVFTHNFDPKLYMPSVFQGVGVKLLSMSFSIAVVGLLFKLLHWPGAQDMLSVGLFGTLGAMGMLLALKAPRLGTILPEVIVLVVCTLVLWLATPVQIFSFREAEDPKAIKLFRNMHEDPENSEKYEAFRSYMDDRAKGIRKLPFEPE